MSRSGDNASGGAWLPFCSQRSMRMVRRLIVSVAGLALVAGSLAFGGPAMASQGHHGATRTPAAHVDNPGGVFRQTPGTHPAKVGGKSISYSTNWSGYA